MKKNIIIIITGALLLSAFSVIITGEDWLQKLQANTKDIKDQVVDYLYNGNMYANYGKQETKQQWLKLTDAQKKDAVTAIGGVIKTFCSSDAGQKAMLDFIKNKKAGAGSREKPDSTAEQYKEVRKNTYEASMSNDIPDDMRFAMLKGSMEGTQSLLGFAADEREKQKIQARIGRYDATMQLYNNKSPEFRKKYATVMADDAATRDYESDVSSYNDLVKGDKEYLAEIEGKAGIPQKDRIKIVLHIFLDNTEGVDYSAQLTGTGTHKRFVNEDYQQKPEMWKFLFRAGKVPGEAARAFAEQWMDELNKQ